MLKNQIRKNENSSEMMKIADLGKSNRWRANRRGGGNEGTSFLHRSDPTIMNYQRNF